MVDYLVYGTVWYLTVPYHSTIFCISADAADGKCQFSGTNLTMGWPFCPNCRHTLTVNATGNVGCSICHYSTNLSAYPVASLPSRTTKSANRPDPLWAKSDEEQAALRNLSEPKRMRVEEPCIKCGAEEVEFYTVQLRSVDEGQTVFYECPKCSHTWSVNN